MSKNPYELPEFVDEDFPYNIYYLFFELPLLRAPGENDAPKSPMNIEQMLS